MWNCPVCQTENSSMSCVCGFDKSRDYESFPTFGRLPEGLPSVSGLMVPEMMGPRRATIKCPECGLETVIFEDLHKPKCSKCGTLLNPADYFDLHCQKICESLPSYKIPDALLYAIKNYEDISTTVEKALSAIRYASYDNVCSLQNSLSQLLPFTEYDADIAFILESIPQLLSKIDAAVRNEDFGHNIFDEQESKSREYWKKQTMLVHQYGFRHYQGAWHFTPFNTENYRLHSQSKLFLDAAAAYDYGNYSLARQLWETAAEEGNPYAFAHLGMLDHYGHGCDQNRDTALKDFHSGAAKGCPLAAAWITEYYRMGYVLDKDTSFSEKLYAALDPELQKMCMAGDPDAQYFRAFGLLRGIGIPEDKPEGIRLLKLAHAQGHRNAATELASCYYYGDGVEVDYDMTFRILSERANPGIKKAPYLLGLCYYWGKGTKQDYIRAFQQFKRAAEMGHNTAKVYLGDCYNFGRGTEVDYVQSAKLYHDAADNHKDAYAAHSLAFLYHNGRGVEKNEKMAVDYWMTAAEGGVPQAQRIISGEYLAGKYLEKDHESARVWMEKAAEQGDADAQVKLGKYYVSDLGFNDEEKAFSWFMKAAEQGHPEALYLVSGCYMYGLYTQENTDLGIEYMIKASDAGYLQASLDLAGYYYVGIENYKGQRLYTNPTLAHKYAMLAVQDETNGDAQYRMGTIIHHAFGNPNGAKAWYLRASHNGHTEAKLELCKLYIQDRESLDQAYRLLRDEIKPDNLPKERYAEALYWRSVCLENGYGCVKDKRTAKDLYNKAIKLGYVDTARKKKRFGLF